MKNLRLKRPILLGVNHHDEGDVVAVPDSRADELVKLGVADHHEGDVDVEDLDNPDHNPLGDTIEPKPPTRVDANGNAIPDEPTPRHHRKGKPRPADVAPTDPPADPGPLSSARPSAVESVALLAPAPAVAAE